MSLLGFDFGTESCITAIAKDRRIEFVHESKPQTPAIVCFGDKQRFIGTAGAAFSTTTTDLKNSISHIKRLIGKKFTDLELQRDLKSLPFNVTKGPDDYPLIHAWYLGKSREFTATQLFGMMLSHLKDTALKNLNAAAVDCCIGIPVYFTDLQRRLVLDAATIAGLHPLCLIHETTATALNYGIYHADLPKNKWLNVAFVDIGHASMQVCIARFRKRRLEVMSHSYDSSLGGRDFDEALFDYFAAKFYEEYKIEVHQNAGACMKLRAACEKLKKDLSTNSEAPLHIENLMNGKDLNGFIKRDQFEQLSVSILQRVKELLVKAIAEAGRRVMNIDKVEVVGFGSRVPSINKILKEVFKMEPGRTMSAGQCVARGAAVQCAILSPTFKVAEYQVNERFPFQISLSWKASSSDAPDSESESTIVFPKGNSIPGSKVLTFVRTRTFSIDVQCHNLDETPTKISTYTIGPIRTKKGGKHKLEAEVHLNIHGIVSVNSATLFEEEIEVPVTKESAEENTKVEGSRKRPKRTNFANTPARKVNSPEKTIIPVKEVVYGALSSFDVRNAVKMESIMALQDREMRETIDSRNAVKAYVYDMTCKLNDKHKEFVIALEWDEFLKKLKEVDDWLCKDGEDQMKGVYIAKLEELKKQGDPIEHRYKEYLERVELIDQLENCINGYEKDVNSPNFVHINIADREKVADVCRDAKNWLRDMKLHEDLSRLFCKPIMIPLSIADESDITLIGQGFAKLTLKEVDNIELDTDLFFSYQGEPWVPDVRDQEDSPFCWSVSSVQFMKASNSFGRAQKGQPITGSQLSPQCLMNGVKRYAAPDDLTIVGPIEDRKYEATPFLALKFVQKRGCDLEDNYRYLGYYQEDRTFMRVADIRGMPFSVSVDALVYSIRNVMEEYGCLIGGFEFDHTWEHYPGPPHVYWIREAPKGVVRELHWAMITGVGKVGHRKPFLQIQNSYGKEWGDRGYGFIGLELFHHIHGLRGVDIRE